MILRICRIIFSLFYLFLLGCSEENLELPSVSSIVISSSPTSPTNQTTASFAFALSPASGTGGFSCQIDDGGWSDCTSPKSYAGLSDGNHKFEVKPSGSDSAAMLQSKTWLVDTVAPTLTLATTPSVLSKLSTVSFGFSSTDVATSVAGYFCSMDGGAYSACSNVSNIFIVTDGSHTFSVKSQDAAGNYSAVSSYTWTTDLTLPVFSLTANPAWSANS